MKLSVVTTDATQVPADSVTVNEIKVNQVAAVSPSAAGERVIQTIPVIVSLEKTAKDLIELITKHNASSKAVIPYNYQENQAEQTHTLTIYATDLNKPALQELLGLSL